MSSFDYGTTNSMTTDPYAPSTIQNAETYMNSERPLTPKMVSSLLNVSVLLQNEYTHTAEVADDTFSITNAVFILFASIAFAAIVGTTFLYTLEIGPFYNNAEVVGSV